MRGPFSPLRRRVPPESSRMRENPFSSRATFWLVAVGLVSFLVTIGFTVFGAPPAAPPSRGADSFSRSAIGHHAFVALLRELEIPVVVSHWESAKRADSTALLILTEPAKFKEAD